MERIEFFLLMKKINNWDDIPSLDGLQVGWEHKPETCEDKRSAIRIKNEDISKLFSVNEILVKVVTVVFTVISTLGLISFTDCVLNFLLHFIPYLLHKNKCKHLATSLFLRI